MDAKKTIAVVLLVCLCVIVGWFGRGYYDNRDADNNDASVTIQQAERDNQSARNDVGNAATQIDDAQSKLDSGQADVNTAIGRLDELQDRADADATIIDECQSLIDVGSEQLEEAERIFADIDIANKRDE